MPASRLGVSRSIVHRAWQRDDVQPHRVERFKLSNDPRFAELDRTAPILPLRPGLPERRTHDYKGNGTATLFDAFDILNGSREFVRKASAGVILDKVRHCRELSETGD